MFKLKLPGKNVHLQSSDSSILEVPAESVAGSMEVDVKIKAQRQEGRYEAMVHVNGAQELQESVLIIVDV